MLFIWNDLKWNCTISLMYTFRKIWFVQNRSKSMIQSVDEKRDYLLKNYLVNKILKFLFPFYGPIDKFF